MNKTSTTENPHKNTVQLFISKSYKMRNLFKRRGRPSIYEKPIPIIRKQECRSQNIIKQGDYCKYLFTILEDIPT